VSTLSSLEGQLPRIGQQIATLEKQYAHTRANAYLTRRNILSRIREAEKKYDALLAKILKIDPGVGIGSLYRATTPRVTGGLHITVEISLDGHAYSNPAPSVPADHHVYVRAIIDDAHRGFVGVPETHESYRVRWRIGRGYRPLDPIKAAGHDVLASSTPLYVVREFTAPHTNTAQNFLVFVDPYTRVRS
jgi:hypothetical protein